MNSALKLQKELKQAVQSLSKAPFHVNPGVKEDPGRRINRAINKIKMGGMLLGFPFGIALINLLNGVWGFIGLSVFFLSAFSLKNHVERSGALFDFNYPQSKWIKKNYDYIFVQDHDTLSFQHSTLIIHSSFHLILQHPEFRQALLTWTSEHEKFQLKACHWFLLCKAADHYKSVVRNYEELIEREHKFKDISQVLDQIKPYLDKTQDYNVLWDNFEQQRLIMNQNKELNAETAQTNTSSSLAMRRL